MTSPMVRITSSVHARLVFSRRTRILADHVVALVPAEARTILDVGCGDGSLSQQVMERRPTLVVDGVEVGLRPSTAISVSQFDGFTLPFADGSRDVVLIVDVLHHAADPARLLREAARVARLGVLVKDHIADAWWQHIRLRAMDWVGNVGHGVRLPYTYWSRRQWKSGFEQAALREVSRVDDLGLYPAPLTWIFDDDLHFFAYAAVPAATARR